MVLRIPTFRLPGLIFGVLIFVLLVLAFKNDGIIKGFLGTSDPSEIPQVVESNVKIALVTCGKAHADHVVTLVKSAIIFASRMIDFYIITEQENNYKFIEHFERWPEAVKKKFTYQFTEPYFPSDDEINWKYTFRVCGTEKLFLPEMYNTIDSMLYLDADLIFFDDVVKLWDELKRFNDKQIVAFAPDFYSKEDYPFRPAAKIPYYRDLGLNSGLMLMNMTRIREFKMHEKLVPLFKKHEKNLIYTEQCLLNTLFHNYPDHVYDLDCSWNFFFVYCEKKFTCPSANDRGVQILHGIAWSFHNGQWPDPKFKLIYQTFEHYDFKMSADQIYSEIQSAFVKHNSSLCSHRSTAFLKNLAQLESS